MAFSSASCVFERFNLYDIRLFETYLFSSDTYLSMYLLFQIQYPKHLAVWRPHPGSRSGIPGHHPGQSPRPDGRNFLCSQAVGLVFGPQFMLGQLVKTLLIGKFSLISITYTSYNPKKVDHKKTCDFWKRKVTPWVSRTPAIYWPSSAQGTWFSIVSLWGSPQHDKHASYKDTNTLSYLVLPLSVFAIFNTPRSSISNHIQTYPNYWCQWSMQACSSEITLLVFWAPFRIYVNVIEMMRDN